MRNEEMRNEEAEPDGVIRVHIGWRVILYFPVH